MDLDDLARHVGEERFQRACAWTVARAPGYGRGPDGGSEHEDDTADVPHELSDLVEGDLDLALALYRVMPCYGNLMYVGHWAPRDEFLARIGILLDDPDPALADPASYWVWCGPFESDEGESASAWHALRADAAGRRLQRLIDISGPVPWPAKAPTLVELAADARWHPALWWVVHSATADYFGRVDAPAAERLLAALGDPPPELDVVALRHRLQFATRHE
ncbi:hypothetical protein [Actinomycetospora aeridis]|uniref:Uncharacterized protein n=1 Tax=Actinomycetospora aeridis TaxID=3129231 RepID=A0ABU8MZT1_9PSEU